MPLDPFDVFATRCGVIVQLYWENRLGHKDNQDCDCAFCDTNTIYDQRGSNGKVCLRCECQIGPENIACDSSEFICLDCEENLKLANGAECAFCCAPVFNGECSSFDK